MNTWFTQRFLFLKSFLEIVCTCVYSPKIKMIVCCGGCSVVYCITLNLPKITHIKILHYGSFSVLGISNDHY